MFIKQNRIVVEYFRVFSFGINKNLESSYIARMPWMHALWATNMQIMVCGIQYAN